MGARLAAVQERIRNACVHAGRSAADVRLIAVSKQHGPEAIRDAHAAGQREFGENYVQELEDKAQTLSSLDGIRFRFIGRLQRNKIKRLVTLGATLDTVDSQAAGEAIDHHVAGLVDPRPREVLVQVNLADEPRKAGCTLADLDALVDRLRALTHLSVQGLLAIPPVTSLPEAARPHFAALRSAKERLGLSELSMGMSADLEVAIEEGATMVRVGSAIFGPR